MLFHDFTQINMRHLLPPDVGPKEIDVTTSTFRAMFESHFGGQTGCSVIQPTTRA
jgi:hypothetical protein